jgi:hypothetical protein
VIPRLAELIAKFEGYGIPGAIPTTHANPGDLEHAPGATHTAGDPIGEIDTPADGWHDLVRQLNIYVTEHPNWTVAQAIYEFAPPSENDTIAYLTYVLNGLGCSADTLLSDALTIPGQGVYSDEPT